MKYSGIDLHSNNSVVSVMDEEDWTRCGTNVFLGRSNRQGSRLLHAERKF